MEDPGQGQPDFPHAFGARVVQNARVYLTITSTADHATDLGFLLHKHPGRAQSFEVAAGTAHVFYPEATEQRCTAALLLEVDPIALVRGRRFGGDTFSLSQYVNDRPYAASSMLAVALGKVFRTAMAGRCVARPDLPGLGLPLEIHVPALPSVGGLDLVSRFFEPLGWAVEVTSIPLDLSIPAWGDSEYVDLRLRGNMPLSQALSHLYVLLPVLDNAKHYWVTSDEVDKLVRAGSGWLQEHPERDLIARRYLAHQQDRRRSAREPRQRRCRQFSCPQFSRRQFSCRQGNCRQRHRRQGRAPQASRRASPAGRRRGAQTGWRLPGGRSRVWRGQADPRSAPGRLVLGDPRGRRVPPGPGGRRTPAPAGPPPGQPARG
jgi:hypothetical protein